MLFIDTQIWVFAQKKPKKEKFAEIDIFKEFLKNHNEAKTFLRDKLQKEEIAMTYHQLGEIFHSLAFRGDKLSLEFCMNYCKQLLYAQFLHFYPTTRNHIKRCITLSNDTGIHIWDYICVMPLIHEISEIYSCDIHFQHDTFKKLGKPIINPLERWMKF